jgi:WD40 repeat protein
MKYGPINATSSSIITTGNDGSFVIKDLRQPSEIIAQRTNICTLRNSHRESLLSFALGYDGFIVALSSSKGYVHFIDLRKMASERNAVSLLGSYVNSHRDAVTQVEFHAERTSLLLSAGEDGLICTYDTTKPTEDLAMETVINTGTPCRKAGFCDSFIFCLSGSETASIWDCHTATCANDFGNFALRDTLGRTAALPINYLVDAQWDPITRRLLLCAGNYEGNATIFTYDLNHRNSFWDVSELLIGGHHGVVRAWCPSTTSKQEAADGTGSTKAVFFTAGEDARICEWNNSTDSVPLPLLPNDISMLEPETMDTNMATNRTHAMNRIGGPVRRQRRSSTTAAKPY